METFKGLKAIHAKTRKSWRTWLSKNHAKHKPVWLIFYRKGSKTRSVTYSEAVEEALCFGWIDSLVNKRDDESWYQYFAPRKPSSRWSKLNKDRVKVLLEQGLMHATGMAAIEIAKETGMWTAFDHAQAQIIPDDLLMLFKKNKKAFDNFQAFPPFAKRYTLEWIASAKRPETRKKRIEQTVILAKQNIRVLP